ncbi:NAD(P)/FAD-dependent oxidoreductase [bacterium]|nr:NAD(P)/FAD-dependent oxidoreductase [bacterium]
MEISHEKHIYDVIIIGAGASGLMAALSAAKRNYSILIVDKNRKVGQKILISGGGRCNFTNLNVATENYVSEQPRFCMPALKAFTNQDFINWLEEASIAYDEKENGQLFCKTSSKVIVNTFLEELQKRGVSIKTNCAITSIKKEKDAQFAITTNEAVIKSHNVIIATGGLSYPLFGATDFGYEVAKQFGHRITDIVPALDSFLWPEKENDIFSSLSGRSMSVVVKIQNKKITGDLLFTHRGLSGPAILKASLYWNSGQQIQIDYLPHISDFLTWFHEIRQEHTKKTLFKTLSLILPDKVVQSFCLFAGVTNQKISEVSKKDVLKLKSVFKEFVFVPRKTSGYSTAEVTRGGVATKDICAKTMESKIVPGLFFTGEVLDVTGSLGGYNLQWAWSSGWVAGQSIVHLPQIINTGKNE